MKITITKIKEIEWENHKLFLEKWSLNGFTRYCTFRIYYLSTPNPDDPLKPITFLFSKMRGPFYDSEKWILRNWEETLEYFKNHISMYAAYNTDNTISYKMEDIDHIEENDENYDLIPKLHEFVNLYKEEKDNG